jgi:4-alpha-glucanotransferase
VHPASYDVWRERDAFAEGVSAGAPPDTFFTKGQDWGFPALHPQRIREQEYRYPIACLRHLMRRAAVLRLDHVMWMHRLFWVPSDLEARDGVYVRYPAEELYAILCLESHRARTVVVGEDLGTVPPAVRRAMARRGVLRTSVLQYELRPNLRAPLRPIPASAMASLNTHDMPPFASMWEGRDIEDRLSLGLLDDKAARKEHRDRDRARRALIRLLRREGRLESRHPSGPEVLRGALRHVAASKARMAVIALEDLWWETLPQNTPGTDDERPNWRRRARLAFESFRESPEVVGTLQEMDRLRRGTES